MRITELALKGVFTVDIEPASDERGLFARTFDDAAFAQRGMTSHWVQSNTSFNARRGTLRGMHFQRDPMGETKLVRCTRGAAFDVVIDLRPESPTFRQWASIELTAENRRAVYIPTGCAHGFQALEDNTELLYLMGQRYSPEHAAGVRWDDPAFGIRWPDDTRIISAKDRAFPDVDQVVPAKR